jgi:hypothetical protein
MQGAGRWIYFKTDVVVPDLKVHFLFRVKSGAVEQFTAVFGHPRLLPEYQPGPSDPSLALYEFTYPEVGNSSVNPYNDYFQGIVGWEWNGGSRQAPTPPPPPHLRVSASQVDRCAGGNNCTALRFTADQAMDKLFVVYRLRTTTGVVDRWLSFADGQTTATTYFGPGELIDSADAIPGLAGVVHVGWLGGATDGSDVQICSAAC